MALELVGTYTITSTCGQTVAEQTIKEYRDEEKKMTKNVIEKETRNSSGTSVKLIESTFTFTDGYPPLLFDAVLLTINGKTTTLFNAFLCSVTSPEHTNIFNAEAERSMAGIEFSSFKDQSTLPEYIKNAFPEFMMRCGFTVQKQGTHPDMLDKLRHVATDAYSKVIASSPSACPVEDLRDYLINDLSKKEHMVFAQLGLTVPTKCQKAMFSMMAEIADVEEGSPAGIKGLS